MNENTKMDENGYMKHMKLQNCLPSLKSTLNTRLSEVESRICAQIESILSAACASISA